MTYWGKVTNTLNNIAGTGGTSAQLQTELKRKDKIIKQLEGELMKLKEDNQFINKAYEELDESTKKQNDKEKQLKKMGEKCTSDIVSEVRNIQSQLCQIVLEKINNSLEEELGSTLQQKPTLQILIDCTDFFQQHFQKIFSKEEAAIEAQFKISEKELSNLRDELSNFRRESEDKLKEQKQESNMIIKELKSMLVQEKGNVQKLRGEVNVLKVSQEKYQKQIYNKCEQNNALITKVKDLQLEGEEKSNQIRRLDQVVGELSVEKERVKMCRISLSRVKKQLQSTKTSLSELIGDIAEMPLLDPSQEKQWTLQLLQLTKSLCKLEQNHQQLQTQQKSTQTITEAELIPISQQPQVWAQTSQMLAQFESSVKQQTEVISEKINSQNAKMSNIKQQLEKVKEKQLSYGNRYIRQQFYIQQLSRRTQQLAMQIQDKQEESRRMAMDFKRLLEKAERLKNEREEQITSLKQRLMAERRSFVQGNAEAQQGIKGEDSSQKIASLQQKLKKQQQCNSLQHDQITLINRQLEAMTDKSIQDEKKIIKLSQLLEGKIGSDLPNSGEEEQKQISEQLTYKLACAEQQVAAMQQKSRAIESQLELLQRTQEQLKTYKQEVRQKQQQIHALKEDIELMKEMNSSLDDLYQKLTSAEKTIEEFKMIKDVWRGMSEMELNEDSVRQFHRKNDENQKAKSQLEEMATRLKQQSSTTLQQLEDDKLKNEKRLRDLEDLVANLEGEISQKDKQNQQLRESCERERANFEEVLGKIQMQKQQKIRQGNDMIVDRQRRNLELCEQIQRLENQIQKLKNQIVGYKKEIGPMKVYLQKLEKNGVENEERSNKLEKAIKVKEEEIKKQEENIKQLEQREIASKNQYEQEIKKLQKEVERVLVESVERIKKEKSNMGRQISDREQIFKAEKKGLQNKHLAEVEKIKGEIKNREKRIGEKDEQIKDLKEKWTEEKKNVAQLNAKIEQMKKIQNKAASVETNLGELKTKLLMKEEELKKAFSNMQNLKSTILELEAGIQTFQSYAEDKNQEIEAMKLKLEQLNAELSQSNTDRDALQVRLDQQLQLQTIASHQSSNGGKMQCMGSQRKEVLLPVKRLFIQYFEPDASYEHKVQILNTLSQVLGFDRKEQELLKQYKKSRVKVSETQSRERSQQAIQNKFFEFLTSDK